MAEGNPELVERFAALGRVWKAAPFTCTLYAFGCFYFGRSMGQKLREGEESKERDKELRQRIAQLEMALQVEKTKPTEDKESRVTREEKEPRERDKELRERITRLEKTLQIET
ncbi:hypothetical protein ACHQM5_012313 [Ranunculus cassubicifolius]